MPKIPLKFYETKNIKDLRDMLDQNRKEFATKYAFLTKPVKGEPYVPITYEQYAKDIDAIGTGLLKICGLTSGTATGILGEARYEWYVSYLASVNGQTVVVPLDKELPPKELANLIIRGRLDALVLDEKFINKFIEAYNIAKSESGDLKLKTIIIMGNAPQDSIEGLTFYTFENIKNEGEKLICSGERIFLDNEIDPLEMRILLFTSGTTASSKAVMHNHKTICTNLMAMCKLVNITPEDTFFSILPLHHTYECTCGFLCPIYRGATIAQCESLRSIPKNLKESKATVLLVVPLVAETFHNRIKKGINKDAVTKRKVQAATLISRGLMKIGVDKRRDFFKPILDQFGGHLRLLIAGGAAIKPEIIDTLNDYGILTLQGYGLTECAPIIALNPDYNSRSFSAGVPLPGVDIQVFEPGEDGIGEFIAKGDNVMLGYYEDEKATSEAIDQNGYFHTGDLGYINDEGFLVITGRKKNVIVTDNGKNIYPEEIEFMLSGSDFVSEVIVSSSTGTKGEIVITAEIFPNKEALAEAKGKDFAENNELVEELLDNWITDINHKLPPYKAVKKLVVRNEEFEKNTSKKIKRKYSK